MHSHLVVYVLSNHINVDASRMVVHTSGQWLISRDITVVMIVIVVYDYSEWYIVHTAFSF